MKIVSQVSEAGKQIFVEHERPEAAEIATFLREADDSRYDSLEITFGKTLVLPQEMVEHLAGLDQRGKTVIYAMERTLWSYLLKLGITACYRGPLSFNENLGGLRAIGIGGSAGSLEKIIELIKALPPDQDISVFITMHIRANQEDNLAGILQHYTPWPVLAPSSDTLVETKTIYCAPPAHHMIVVGRTIYLTREKRVNYARPSISVLFSSLAWEYHEGLCTVLLCGYGSDGSDALETVKQNKGMVIVEDLDECVAKELPNSALASGYYDRMLPVEGISRYFLDEFVQAGGAPKEELDHFLEEIYQRYECDFRGYHLGSIQRRINLTMGRLKVDNFRRFAEMVLSDGDLFKELFFDFSINVTAFFRNPAVYRYLREKVMPYLDSFHHVKIWCAGCASGEEPYSLAIMLEELGMLGKSQIFATDFNSIILKEASNGLFSRQGLVVNQRNYLEAGGSTCFDQSFDLTPPYLKVEERLRDRILFFQHNLATDEVMNEFQLIICRNVMIYFNEQLKKRVFDLFNRSLIRNGFLLLGESEKISHSSRLPFALLEPRCNLYKKTGLEPRRF